MTSEIIYATTDSFRDRLDMYRRDMVTADIKTTVFKSDTKISIVESHLLTGLNRISGKRWWKWKSIQAFGFYQTSTGNWQPFHMNRPTNAQRAQGWRNITAQHPVMMLDEPRYGGSEHSAVFREHARALLGVNSFHELYPMAEHFGVDSYVDIPFALRKAFKQTEIRPFVEEVFGKSRYRRDLLKVTAESYPYDIALMREFRGLTPVDWLVDWMRKERPQAPGPGSPNIRNLLIRSNPKSYRSILRRDFTGRDAMLIANMGARRAPGHVFEVNADRPFRTWEEMHNSILGPQRYGRRADYALEPFTHKEIELTDLAKKFDGLQVGKLVIEPAKHTEVMTAWGNLMNNCIASYARNAVAGTAEYAAVLDGDKVIANLEVRDNKLVQLLGRFNRALPEGTREPVAHALASVGVDTSGNWWGKEDL